MSDTILNITLKKGIRPGEIEAPKVAVAGPLAWFKGPESMPFLAPRGVCLQSGSLLVSDTGRNRVFIWHQLPQGLFQEPDVVLGQEDAEGVGRNAGGKVSARTLQYPSGIWSDGTRLIVADAWNHRVLIWHTPPVNHWQDADVVIGQPGFHQNEPNVSGVGATPTGRSLYWPYGIFSDGKSLWIADTGNRRVLFFETIPTVNYPHADGVIGKPDFMTRDYDNQDPIWPYSVKIRPDGAMAITDTQYYRVLLWRNWRDALTQKADCIIGQPDLDSNGQNQYGLSPQANTLSWCYDSAFFKEGLLVADTGNSRILRFSEFPDLNNASADGLIGKPDFQTSSENAATVFGTDDGLYWPFSICTDGNLLAIADTGNHRIAFYTL
ncbi:MAG: hypothetical protein HUU01_16680 [Saprospiraceae bacterium]|nr:hypothetical protein [Saprospiraceae bacterium]